MLTFQQLGGTNRERIMEKLRNFLKEESGATAVDYCLMAALISLVIVAAVTKLGTNLSPLFNTAAGDITGS
jgi:pilus assembly protein Flp/PilA